ncbi:MAG: hypothetical protein KC729_19805, partial [Candidatus Eisenbacteria bacterium]|nr:hypothetical protein [Candidatus Eisenbacteria bacterium]
ASQEGHDRGFAAHNEVVRVLVEQGALGLIAYIAVAYLLLSTTKSYCRRTDSPDKLQFPGLARATYCVLWAFFLACAVGSEIIAATSVLYVLLTIFAILHTSSHEGSQKLQA